MVPVSARVPRGSASVKPFTRIAPHALNGSLREYMVHLRDIRRKSFSVRVGPSRNRIVCEAERWPRQALPALLMTEAVVWAACTVSALARVKCAS